MRNGSGSSSLLKAPRSEENLIKADYKKEKRTLKVLKEYIELFSNIKDSSTYIHPPLFHNQILINC